MVSHLASNKTREKLIKDMMEQQCRDANRNLPTAKLAVQGVVRNSAIYRFPLKTLHFNKANGRIKSEVLAKQAQLGRLLDAENENDQKILRELILDIRRDENEKIKMDLVKNGQMMTGIISSDGVVINGNRRKALLEKLFDEEHSEKYNYLEVQVLPSSINKAELWLIEAGIQLSAPQQLDYSPINNLLKLREGIDSGIEVADMAARIYGMSEEKLREDLERLDLIDEYLDDYLDKKGRYYLIEQKNEHFINLQNILKWAERPRGAVKKDWDPDQSDIAELKVVAFNYIRAQFGHLRIRELRDIFAITSSWEELKNALEIEVETDDDANVTISTDGLVFDENENENENENETNEIVLESELLDFKKEQNWKHKNIDILKEYFENAKEQLQIKIDSTEPITLARRAYKNLCGIDDNVSTKNDPDLDKVLGDIVRKVNELRNFKIRKKQSRKKTSNKKKQKK